VLTDCQQNISSNKCRTTIAKCQYLMSLHLHPRCINTWSNQGNNNGMWLPNRVIGAKQGINTQIALSVWRKCQNYKIYKYYFVKHLWLDWVNRRMMKCIIYVISLIYKNKIYNIKSLTWILNLKLTYYYPVILNIPTCISFKSQMNFICFE